MDYEINHGECGTFQHSAALPSVEPAGAGRLGPSGEGIVRPLLSGATDLSERNRHESRVSERNRSSTQRCDPRNTAIVADTNDVTTNYGENNAQHTPSQAGRALPGSHQRPTADLFDNYQNCRRPEAPASSASGVAARGHRARNAAAPRQRPEPLTDTARILRAQRLRDLLQAIAEWQRATGPERAYARRNTRYDIREWRRLYEAPEAAAFMAAVARSRQHKEATP